MGILKKVVAVLAITIAIGALTSCGAITEQTDKSKAVKKTSAFDSVTYDQNIVISFMPGLIDKNVDAIYDMLTQSMKDESGVKDKLQQIVSYIPSKISDYQQTDMQEEKGSMEDGAYIVHIAAVDETENYYAIDINYYFDDSEFGISGITINRLDKSALSEMEGGLPMSNETARDNGIPEISVKMQGETNDCKG